MLYAGCSVCQGVTPLWCSGQFMPHMPVPAVATQTGYNCQVCGALPPIFTCTYCWTRQLLYLPGSQQTQPSPSVTQYMAPVVQANPGLGQHELNSKFSDVAKKALVDIGKECAISFFKAWLAPKQSQ